MESHIFTTILIQLYVLIRNNHRTFLNCVTFIVYVDTARIWDSPYSGQIRLTGGEYSNQGLLEIYCNGQWGTVCDDSFGATDAQVTCRQLGYNYYYTYDTLPQ